MSSDSVLTVLVYDFDMAPGLAITMIKLKLLQTLILQQPSHKHRHSHLSAASGLVQIGDWLYVVADDENHIGIFNHNDAKPGILKTLLPGNLPVDYEARKEAKPDLEILTLVPPIHSYPYGALLALGSGSKKKRHQGVIIELDNRGALKQVDVINLEKLYDLLKEKMEKINIEGAVVSGEDLLLFHRGNKKNKVNSTIRLPLDGFYQAIIQTNKKALPTLKITIQDYELGAISNIPLCFTDATALPDGSILFTATAENTDDAYLDGACMGSSIGIIDSRGALQKMLPIDKTVKVEGISARVNADKVDLLLVTDADNAAIPAQLYAAELYGYPFSMDNP